MRRIIRVGGPILLSIFVLALLVRPAGAISLSSRSRAAAPGTTSVNATIYLPTATLLPIFQSHMNQMIPGAFNKALNDMINKVPLEDQGWVSQMAAVLVQPSATIAQLTPQPSGLATTVHISLYNGDPRPLDAQMLVSFRALDASTIQVSTQPVGNGPTLVNGPLTTFQVPFGQLNSINTTPGCGASALAVHLQIPLTATSSAPPVASTSQNMHLLTMHVTSSMYSTAAENASAYVEIPATSLAALGPGLGTIPINTSLSAQNIKISVQGGNIVIVSDILFGGFKIASATTTMQPQAVGGNIVAHVLKTTLSLFQFFSFPVDSYDQQIERQLNARLSGMLAGKLNVTEVTIGSNVSISCAASDSLILAGTTSIGV